MKKKIFSILFALVLVLSFSLVMATPVSAYDVHDSSPDSNNSWTCEAAGPLIWAKVQAGMTEDEAAASFASGSTKCEVKDLAVSGPAYVGQPVTVTGTVDMTAWVQCIGWNYYGVEVWAESLGYAAVTDTPESFSVSNKGWTITGALEYVHSPWKWSDHAYGVDEYGWWFHVDTNDESQVWDFSITFTPTHTGEYTLFAGGRVQAGYWSDADYFGEPWFPHPDPDYGRGGGVTVSCQEPLEFEVLHKIDIKPGSDPNSINLKSKGLVPVAVLTTEGFDASTIDPETVLFAGAEPVRSTLEDVDGDGDLDMLFHFKTQELNLDEDSTEATLTGETNDGTPIQGTDTVNIVPKSK